MTRVGRRLLIVLAIIGGMLTGLVVGLKSRRVARNIRYHVEQLVGEQTGLQLDIGRLELELLPPAVVLHDVHLRHPKTPTPRLRVHESRVRVRPWPSSAGAIVVDLLAFEGLSGQLHEDDLARLQQLSGGGGAGARLQLRHVVARETTLALRSDKGTLRIEDAQLEVSPKSEAGQRISMAVERGSVRTPTDRWSFATTLRGQLKGGLTAPQHVQLDALRVAVNTLELHASGGLSLQGRPQIALELRAQTELARLHKWFPQTPAMQGQASFEGRISGALAAPRVRVDARVAELQLAQRLIGTVALSAVHRPGTLHRANRLHIESFRVEHPRAGTLTGSGGMHLRPPYSFDVASKLHRVSLPEVLELAGLQDPWIRLWLTAKVEATGQLQPFALKGDIDGDVEDLAALDGPFERSDSGPVFAPEAISLKGPFRINADGVSIDALQLQRGSSRFVANGGLSFDQDVGLAINAVSQRANLAEMGTIADVPFTGVGELAATVEGPYTDVAISGTVNMSDFGLLGVPLGETTGTLILEDGMLEVPRATVRNAGGTAQAELAIDLTPPPDEPPTLVGQAAFRQLPLGAALRAAGFEHPRAQSAAARLQGSVRVDGPVQRPSGTFSLEAEDVNLDGVALGELTLDGGFLQPRRLAWAELSLSPEVGQVQANLQANSDGTLALQLGAEGLPMRTLTPFMGDVALRGPLRLSARLDGPPDALDGELSARVASLTAYGVELGDTAVQAAVAAGKLALSGSTLDGHGDVSGSLRLASGLPFNVQVDLAQVPLHALPPRAADLQAHASGTLTAAGRLLRPESLVATLRLPELEASWRDFSVVAEAPIVLRYRGERLRVESMRLRSQALRLQLAGSLGLDRTLAMEIAGTARLAQLSAFWGTDSGIESGSATLQVALQGPLTAPSVDGRVTLKDGVYAYRSGRYAQRIEAVNGTAVLRGRSFTLQDASARIGSGTAYFSGGGALPLDSPLQLDLTTRLDDAVLAPSPELNATASGTLSLLGPVDGLTLKGDLELESLRYTANIDLERLIPSRDQPPLSVPAIDPNDAVELLVNIDAPNNLVLSNNVLEAEFSADLMVTGTTKRLGLVGSLTPLWARARYQNNVFTVDRGSIVFTEEYRIHTQFDVLASTQACGMDIDVSIQGDSERYNVVPSAQDENGAVNPQDVLMCLQFGLRARDFTGQQPTSGISSNLPASSLDALWTVSGMDEQVRRYIPVDEFRLTSAWSPRSKRTIPRVVIGKEIGQDLQLSYARSLDQYDDQVVSVEYQVSRNATLQGSWISETDMPVGDFGLDLRLHWEFE